ncbi:unnamed protein product [Ectocarpus sp. CCAP 1310/34]|nr:unnamed protein product [Ectocarpus sp. CCAP 1310/34]
MGEAKVHFLHQEELLECLRQAMEQKLAGANQSRTFYSQVILPDMDFGTPETTTTTAAAGTSSKNPGDRGDASPDTEGPTPPEGSGGGGGASASQRLSSRRSPPAPRNVGLEAMVESDEGDEEEAGGDAGSSSGEGDNVGQEEEEGKCSASVATSGDRSQEKPSAGNGTGGAVAAEAERPDEEKTPQTKPSSNNKQNKMKPSKRKKQAKPFAGISKLGGPHQNCNCCGGRAPRGPDGSIVLTQGAGATGGSSSSSGTPGDGIDGVPYRGTPSSQDSSSSSQAAAVRAQQQHRRPDTFVETSVKYNSVRSLIADFKTQASETGLKPEGRGGGSRGDFRLCVEACSWLCAHKGLTQMLRKYSFVGMVDLHLSLLQFNTKLVLVNHTALSTPELRS